MQPQGDPLTGKGGGSDQDGTPCKPVALTREDHEFYSTPLKSADCGLWGGIEGNGLSRQFCYGPPAKG